MKEHEHLLCKFGDTFNFVILFTMVLTSLPEHILQFSPSHPQQRMTTEKKIMYHLQQGIL